MLLLAVVVAADMEKATVRCCSDDAEQSFRQYSKKHIFMEMEEVGGAYSTRYALIHKIKRSLIRRLRLHFPALATRK